MSLELIFSTQFVFFKNMQYPWGILPLLIMWMSSIFHAIDSYQIFVLTRETGGQGYAQ